MLRRGNNEDYLNNGGLDVLQNEVHCGVDDYHFGYLRALFSREMLREQ